jgi:hypothetical protein
MDKDVSNLLTLWSERSNECKLTLNRVRQFLKRLAYIYDSFLP